MSRHKEDSGTETVSKETVKVKRPRQFQVLLLNDDYTTMDFVVMILERIFRKSPAEAVQVMLQVHNKGQGICGIYTKEVAETKIAEVHVKAKERGFPLKCSMQEV